MYDHLEARLHDLFWASEGQSQELPLIEDFLTKHPGPALELGCGSGRLLFPLITRGHNMEGLDNSADMIRLCHERCSGKPPLIHHACMEDFDTGSSYAAISIPAFTLQLIAPEKVPQVLKNIHTHLQPGGGLYLTIFIPWAEITGELEEGCWFLDHEALTPEGHTARCHTRFRIQHSAQSLRREHRYEIVDESGLPLEQSSSRQNLRWYRLGEMTQLLKDAGFVIEQVIGDFDTGTEPDDQSQILTLIASRRADSEL